MTLRRLNSRGLLFASILLSSRALAQFSEPCLNGGSFGDPIGAFNPNVEGYSNCDKSYDPVHISAATNANPVVFTAYKHGLQANNIQKISINGGTGNWSVVNDTFVVTVYDANTFSIQVDSTNLGLLTGTLTGDYANRAGTGLEWQCVEFVRRYWATVYNAAVGLLDGYQANGIFDAASNLGLQTFKNNVSTAPPQVGDILASLGPVGSLGHVAIVSSVSSNQVCAVMQNWSEDAMDQNGMHCMPMSTSPQYNVGPFDSASGVNMYPIQGWIRYSSNASTASPPTIQQNGVVNAASFDQILSPGSIFTVFGQNLSLSTGGATTIPLPPTLNGTTILINGIQTPILWTSPTQVDAQIPFETNTGIANLIVQVADAATTASQPITIDVTSPGVFSSNGDGITLGAIEHANGSVVSGASPVQLGETISIYLTGLGATTPALPTGRGGNGQATVLTATVYIGEQSAQVLFSGVSNYPGLYQVNAIVPNLPSGNAEVLVSSGGNTSQVGVLIPIAGSSTSQSLTAVLAANPQTGQAPLSVTLTATSGGTAAGTINYTFYCNRADAGTNITSGYVAKFDGITDNPKSAVCTYPNSGAYTAKVIVERGIGAAQATQSINVSGVTLPPPVITSVQPKNTSAGPTPQIISIVGTGFQAGLTLALMPPTGGTQVLSGNQLQNFSSSTFQASVVLNSAGNWGILVTNPDGQTASTTVTVANQATLTLNFNSWPSVFTVGDPSVSIGLQIISSSSGFSSGTATATTSNGGSWLTVDGHPSATWTITPSVAPSTSLTLTADPTGLAPGTYTGGIAISATNSSNAAMSVPVTMTILPKLQITTTSLPPATWGQPYSYTLQATGGSSYTWSLGSTPLPSNLSLSSSGAITGNLVFGSSTTPYPLIVVVTDAASRMQSANLTLTVEPPLTVTSATQNFQFFVRQNYGPPSGLSSTTFQASGGTPPYSWGASGLPSGLQINPSTGVLVGSPNQPGTFPTTITATDSTGRTGSAIFNLSVQPGTSLQITTTTLPSATLGVPYSQVIAATGGSLTGYQWTVNGLPLGLNGGATTTAGCVSSCYQLTGTPMQTGSYTIIARVTDSLNNSVTTNITLAVNSGSPPAITTASKLPQATIGTPYTLTFLATGGTPPYSWSFLGASPDPGLQLSMGSTKPKIATTTESQIPQELQYLLEEARKHKSVEEFSNAVAIKRTMLQVHQVKKGVGFADGILGGISQTASSTEETRQRLEELVTKSGYSSLTDFYKRATN
jgi:uncharacterized protein (TIGR03437 family)